jgi:hypothetical protein
VLAVVPHRKTFFPPGRRSAYWERLRIIDAGKPSIRVSLSYRNALLYCDEKVPRLPETILELLWLIICTVSACTPRQCAVSLTMSAGRKTTESISLEQHGCGTPRPTAFCFHCDLFKRPIKSPSRVQYCYKAVSSLQR